ncbi:MAG: hypothetical protein AAFX94_14590 [Myxococcota bacterium]
MSKRHHRRDVPDRLEPDLSEFLPDTFFSDFSDSRTKAQARKRAQLCSRVARLIATSLECDVFDEVLQALVLDQVEQAPGGGRLYVTFVAPAGSDLVELNRRLDRVAGVFRDALARGLSRKRVPPLSLAAVPGGGDHE